MNGDIMITLESEGKLGWIIDDVVTDHEVGRCYIVCVQKLHKTSGRLIDGH